MPALKPGQFAVACDLDLTRAEVPSSTSTCPRALVKTGRSATASVEAAVADPEVDAVIVATLNGALAEIAARAIDAGKHVIIEKPAGISVAEIDRLLAAAEKSGSLVRVGYNHRFHPALQKARELVDAGALGPLMFIRARYGHGGRVGYDREWRADPKLSGGGELIDQGVHLVDLAGWFLGDFPTVEGHAATYFWDMPVDDNAFMSLRTASRARPLGCKSPAPSGKTSFPLKSTGARANSPSTAWAAATASNV